MRQIQTDIAEIKCLYEEDGLTLQQIAELLNVTRQAVNYRLSRAGVKMRPRSVRRSVERQLLQQLYTEDGLTLPEIGEQLGASEKTISRELKRHGIVSRRSGPRPKLRFDRDLIYQLYVKDGLTIAQVAKRLGVSPDSVWRRLTGYGIPIRSRGPRGKLFDRKLLHKMYVVKGLSTKSMGSALGVSRSTISKELRRHGIGPRNRGGRPRVTPQTP